MTAISTFRMGDRTARPDFDIRREGVLLPPPHAHRHDHFEIQINIDSDCEHVIAGKSRSLPAKSVCFVQPYRVHQIRRPLGSRYFVINFTQEFLRSDLDVDPLDPCHLSLAKMPELAPFLLQDDLTFSFDEITFNHILAVAEVMVAENAARGLGSDLLIRSALHRLCGLALRLHEQDATVLLSRRRDLPVVSPAMVRVIRYTDQWLAGDLGLDVVAAAVSLSASYVSQLVRKETGKSFTDLVTERRMARACDLLIGTDDRIGSIATAVGFKDENYFNRRFRQRFGMPPTAFRRARSSARND
jgi:AraC-like DNA-binding protein